MSEIRFIFDLDGTITNCETLPIIARHFHLEKEIESLTQSAVRGDVPYIENFIHRVRILGGLPVSEIADLLQTVPLHKRIADFIRRHAEDCVVATTNLDVWIEKLTADLSCNVHCSHASIRDNQINKLESILKKDHLVKQLKNSGFKVVFIGDGHNDMEAMRLADISIASGLTHEPAKSILPFTRYLCYEEKALCRLLEHLC